MSVIINIEMVFDTQTILAKYPNPSQNSSAPTGIAHSDVYMVTQSIFVADPKTQATADLNIKADVDDIIRWRGLSLSDNVSQSVIPYKIQMFSGTQVTTIPVPSEAHPWVPVPNQNPDKSVDPLHYTAQKLPDYYLQCNVTDSGTEGYQVWFYITQESGSTATVLGYFYWDPTITVA
jgi:hypothetical protein